MINYKQGLLLYVAILFLGFIVGGFIQAAAFFGVITLVGLIALVETIGVLKWIVKRTSKVLDVIIFIFTLFATAKFGLNITAALTIAGIGYSLVYAPYIRQEHKIIKAHKDNYIPSKVDELWDKKKS